MPDPQTTNKQLFQPARGADVGTWDTPMNANTGIIDNSFGGTAVVALTNSNIILSPTQYQCVFLNFTGAISANIAVTLPAVGSFYTVQNLTSNTSAFYITLGTTVTGSQSIGVPPGVPVDVMTDGSNVKFRNFGEVGTYWDYSGSSTPSWLAACTVPPRLQCTGATFSSATYPILATILGGNTLPDARGRFRLAKDEGTGRVSSAVCGIAGNTVLAAGGDQSLSQHNHVINITDPGHNHSIEAGPPGNWNLFTGGGPTFFGSGSVLGVTKNAFTGITATSQNAGIGGSENMPPLYVGGLTFIRAA